ncbi:uncharacterized protein B0P05DRAFT_557389 [Gilbertella persicaria]|uniref:Uncharacterized protein n=1 Tax=Rhizopus stolonifer TaxID=4846 RepID=A0A367KLQ9_RHIST|nr:uncharacterized protein B0P05DRAFT_557389 [Gilbertella persicaria]KAI8061525.1 hypothetical protein B0P05DRAFT_557389 [Gilbertella persicaria]RCI02782.1 hypothetical protein CU098_003767 [Rhizopus stolonifer]
MLKNIKSSIIITLLTISRTSSHVQALLPYYSSPIESSLAPATSNYMYSTTSTTNTNLSSNFEPVQDEYLVDTCYQQRVAFSQYWIPRENEWDESNDGDRMFLGATNKNTPLYDKEHKEITKVSAEMHEKCLMEGTCLLENGDLINIDNVDIPTFIKIGEAGRSHTVFGLGSGSQNLVPYVSVAASDLPYGQKLYIHELDGQELGNDMVHNGCVRVDDSSWSFDACHIDLFVPTYIDYLWLDLDEQATIELVDDCELQNYISIHHLIQMKATLNTSIIPLLLYDN